MEGWLYVAALKELFAGELVGRAFGERMTTDLVVRALEQAVATRRPPPELLHHSERGSQYCSSKYCGIQKSYVWRVSMTCRGNGDDNAPARKDAKFPTPAAKLFTARANQPQRM